MTVTALLEEVGGFVKQGTFSRPLQLSFLGNLRVVVASVKLVCTACIVELAPDRLGFARYSLTT